MLPRFLQGGIGLNVAQMIVELIRDKRKIVDRITTNHLDIYIDLLQSHQNYRFLDLLQVLCVCDGVAIPNNQTYITEKWLRSIKVTLMNRDMTKPTKMNVRPAKTQISLGIRPVWSESSLCTQWVAKGLRFLHADSEDSDQTGRTVTLLVLSWGGSNVVERRKSVVVCILG